MSMFALVLMGTILQAPAASQTPPELLVAPTGFAVDLVDVAPNLRWPSAVHCRADGSLLVAEDPMDMPGPSDQPLDRIWLYRWKEDGSFTRTLFAEKLFASFGLEEIDGAIYVMNMPHLTVLRDVDGDGVAEERKELLTDLGPVAPGVAGGFNDHIISGLRYGMDGYLYVACGDKGIPLAHGTDGSTISLRGGGVVRLRPDGSKLEVVARGLRNILDVAMDANGEMFTYDNTDDGLGWWTRLTHVVPGGYYGYPWDYHDRPNRFLAPMAEYGGGSPTGGLVKREGGWPAPYEGSLYFCEWGDQTLRRFQLERDGGTFKVAAMEEFLQPGKVVNFHPTDVCESPDGRFLYVSDWGFGGWVSKEETGRLWRVRKNDDAGRTPGGVEARVGKNATIAQRLASDGWRTRLIAQQEIELKHDEGALIAALSINGRSALHGLYAAREMLEPLRGAWITQPSGEEIANKLLSLTQAEDSELRRVALATLCAVMAPREESVGDSADLEGPRALAPIGFADESPAVRREALELLLAAHDEAWMDESRTKESGLRAEAWRVACENAQAKQVWRSIASSHISHAHFALFLDDGEPQALELLHAVEDVAVRMAETRRGSMEETAPRGPFEDLEASGICALARGEKSGSNPRIRAAALHTLAVLARVCEPWDGKWWSIAPAKLPHPPRTVDWRGTELANATLAAALGDSDPATRRSAITAIRETKDARLAAPIRERFVIEADISTRTALLEALAEMGTAEDAILFGRLARKSKDTDERVRALQIGARLDAERVAPSAAFLAGDDATTAQVSAASLEVLSLIEPVKLQELGWTFDLTLNRTSHPSHLVRRASCKLLAGQDAERALPRLLELFRDAAVRSAAFDALANLDDPRAARVYAQALGDQDPQLRSVARRTVARLRKKLRPALEGMVERQEFNGAVVRELRSIYASYQPILEWDLYGPFATDAAEGKLDFAIEHAALSMKALANAKPQHAASKRPDGLIDLRALLSEAQNQSAYAFGQLESSSEFDVELHAGSDDQIVVWINGARVHEFDGARGFSAESDHFKAHLVAGVNKLVLRVGQIGGDWSFALTAPEEGRGPIFESKLPSQPTPTEYAAFATEHPGDPTRGEVVIRDVNRSLCLRCHAIAGQGEHVGPDLAGLGARYSRTEIMTSILSPSQRILDGYAAVSVLTKGDQLLFGQIKRDDPKGITLIDPTGTPIEIARADVAEVRPSKQSVMPEGICNTLTPTEFADLLAWLSRR